jgi:glycerol-3-phosphate dehydrogenase
MLKRAGEDRTWDFIIVGGGATGLGAAVDAASRGHATLLLEQADFAKGTSSRSTKLVHGGVRYLKQGHLSLVLESLHERGLLSRNAPHLVHDLAFVIPIYDWWEGPFYGIGMKVYDALAGKLGLGPSRWLSREETLERIPTVEPDGLRGGVVYHDAQFDDARLAVALARTAVDKGAVVLNYAGVTALLKQSGRVVGVVASDAESGATLEIRARCVINATGVFADSVRRMDEPGAAGMVAPSQGIHLVLDRSFLPGDSAIMVPHTDDGRVLFAVPWHGRILLGTTDTPVDRIDLEPRPLEEEIAFILKHAARYLTRDPQRHDVLCAFAGLRPLVRVTLEKNTAELARDHVILVAPSGLVTITGGKWTTYRRMAQDVVTTGETSAGLAPRACVTEHLAVHGAPSASAREDRSSVYGSERAPLEVLAASDTALEAAMHPRLPYRMAEAAWSVRHEMARTVEDVLSRRTRALLLDARASIEAAPAVARLVARELGRDEAWAAGQVALYKSVAERHLIDR